MGNFSIGAHLAKLSRAEYLLLMSNVNASAVVRFRLPQSLRVARDVTIELRHPTLTKRVEFSTAGALRECSIVAVELQLHTHAEWDRTLANQVIPHWRTVYGSVVPVNAAIQALAAVLEYAALESARPHAYRQFTEQLNSSIIGFSGQDSIGIRFDELPSPSSLPVYATGTHSVGDESQYMFPSRLTQHALEYLAAAHGPHWEFWQIGHYVSLSSAIALGSRERQTREAIVSFQTALEAAMISVVGWEETKQYSHSTILQFPIQCQSLLASLLLTRNLMLHRGSLALKVMRPGETWKQARGRSASDADGRLTSAELLQFSGAVFDSLKWLEQTKPAIS